MIAASLPEAWRVSYEIVKRAGSDPGFPGLYGPATPPVPVRPLETDGWADASTDAKRALEDVALFQLK